MNNAFIGISIAGLTIAVFSTLPTLGRSTRRAQRDLVALRAHFGLTGPELPLPEPSDAVKFLAEDPKGKIAAIKAYREETGLGLLDAKIVIERLAQRQAGTGI